MTPKPSPLANLLADLACSMGAAQQRLHQAEHDERERIGSALPEGDLSAVEHLIEAAVPPHLALRSLEIELSTLIKTERTGGASLGISLLGQPVHNFLWHRFGVTEQETSRIAFTVIAAPQGHAPPQTQDEALEAGTSDEPGS